jgi:hypothetical protein
MASEVSVHGHLALFFLSCGKEQYHGRGGMVAELLTTWHRGSKKKKKERGTKKGAWNNIRPLSTCSLHDPVT